MSWHRRVHVLLTRVMAGFFFLTGAAGSAADRPPLALSLEEFTNMVLERSLRSRTAADNFKSSELGYVASLRDLSLPRLTASASANKTHSDNDAGTETDVKARTAALSLQQPFLTGTNISLNSTWTDTKTETDTLGVLSESRDRDVPAYTASVTQPLFIFTGNASWRNRREANLRWDIDRVSYHQTRLGIEFDARSIYYNLLLQKQTVAVELKKSESANLVHNATRALVKAGKLAEVELIRADLRAKQDVRRISNAESTYEQRLNQAKDLILLPPDAQMELTSILSYQPFKIPLARLFSLAERHNTDLKVARWQLELSKIALQKTREGTRPVITANGTYTLTRDRSSTQPPLDPALWVVGLGVSYPLFDATQTLLRTRQGEVSLANAERSLESQRRDLRVSVQNTFIEIKRTEEQIVDFKVQRESAERNLKAIRLQYQNGLTRLSDVFDAENELRDLELEYLSLLVSFNTSRDRLKTLIGAPLDESEERP